MAEEPTVPAPAPPAASAHLPRLEDGAPSAALAFVGLNPALQKSLVFPAGVRLGAVNRAAAVRTSVGGKGQQAAIAACQFRALGLPTAVHLLQAAGGDTGEAVTRMLQLHDMAVTSLAAEGATRVCTTLLDHATGDATEVIEPSAPVVVTDAQLAEWMPPAARGVALCGTFPPGCDTAYASVAKHAAAAGVQWLLLDGYKGVVDVLNTHLVHVLKVNVEELKALVADNGVHDGADDGGSRVEAVATMARAAAAHWGLRVVAVTDGPRRAVLVDTAAGSAVQYTLPTLPPGPVNPIGCGDVVTGVMLRLLVHGLAPDAAFGWGLAAASASALHESGAHFDAAAVQSLGSDVTMAAVPM